MKRAALTVVVLVAVLVGAAPALASVEAPVATQPFNTASDAALRTAVVNAYGTTDMTAFQTAFAADDAAKASSGAVKAAQAGRLLPKLSALGNIGLAASAFSVGWAIGTGINKYFGLSGAIGSKGALSTAQWKFTSDLGTGVGLDVTSGIPHVAGWYLFANGSSSNAYNPNAGGFGLGSTVDAAMASIATTAGATDSTTSYSGGATVAHFYWLSESSMAGKVSVVPITSTAYSAFPVGQQLATSSYSPPTYTSGDATAIRTALTAEPTRDARDLVNHELDSSYVPAPDEAATPSCVGLGSTACTAALSAAGFTLTPTYTPTTDRGADLNKPAGAVITQPIAPGVTKPLTFTWPVFTTNPTVLPVELLKPGRNETYDHYLDRLRANGWLGEATTVDLTEFSADPQMGPSAVSRIRLAPPLVGELPGFPWPYAPPHPGPVPSPEPAPQPAPRVPPEAPIVIVRNPPTAHKVPGPTGAPIPDDTLPPDGPDAPGDGTPTDDGLDLSPLSGFDPGCKFPFGFVCYALEVTAWFDVTPHAPVFDFHIVQAGYDLGHYKTDMSVMDAWMAMWRTLLTVVIWIGAVYTLATRLLGFRAGGDPGEAMDDLL